MMAKARRAGIRVWHKQHILSARALALPLVPIH